MGEQNKRLIVSGALGIAGAAAAMAALNAEGRHMQAPRKNHRTGSLNRKFPAKDERKDARKRQKKARAITRKKG
ncbi:MAG: hypothetical protein FD152_3193 [Xanthobacteraceae bacterium]|nr:MAG: hypothetical protein FD152_3193 [Xanthobacteraceae bacterium]